MRAPSIQEISRLLLPVAEQSQVPSVYSTPDGAAFKEYVFCLIHREHCQLSIYNFNKKYSFSLTAAFSQDCTRDNHLPHKYKNICKKLSPLRDCDVIQEKTDELTDLVKGLHSRLDAQKQAKIDALQDKVKEYEKEMDRLRDLIGK